MKSKNCKQHDHKLTKFLKVFIYMLVMLAPFLAIGVKCWYVSTNKNANESYRGEYKYSASIVENITHVNTINNEFYAVGPEEYKYDTQNLTIYRDTAWNGYQNVIFCNYAEFEYNGNLIQTTNNLTIFSNNNNIVIRDNNTDYLLTYGQTYNLLVKIDPNSDYWYKYNGGINEKYGLIKQWRADTFIVDTTLSSVFYSAVDELDKASIFSWTTETAIYTAINNMCSTLGIVSPPLAVLLTYWSLITVIYVIIDIVIEAFVYLTHWFNDRMV